MGLEESSPTLIIIYICKHSIKSWFYDFTHFNSDFTNKQLVIILYVDKLGNRNVHVIILSFVKD